MKFEFTYKTSDGARHADTICASSADNAFALLRERGIKPIRLARAKPKGIVGRIAYFLTSAVGIAVTVAAVAVAVATVAVVDNLFGERQAPAAPHVRHSSGAAFKELSRSVALVAQAHADAFSMVDFALLRNYALIAEVSDLQKLYAEITKARIVIGNTRERLRAIFANAPTLFAGDKDGLAAAQALYGEQMSKVDADEAQIESDEAAIALLDENRAQWKVVRGKLVFSNDSLRKDFEMLSQAVNPATARWHKDFAPKAIIESEVIEIPRKEKP